MLAVTVVALLLIFATGLVLNIFIQSNRNSNVNQIKNALRIFGVILLLISISSRSFKIIDAGTVGVQSLFGEIKNDALNEGLNLINPLIDVSIMDIKTQNYTMSGIVDEGDKSGDDAISVLTKDGLEVIIDLSVLYKIDPTQAPKLMKEVGVYYRQKIVRPVARTMVRDNAVHYDAIQLFGSKRDEFQNKIFDAMSKEFNKRGILLENLLVRNIKLPESVKKVIEEKIQAEQEAQKMTFVLQKEKQEAERKRVEAQGIADYQKIINQGLTKNQLQYEQIKAYKEIANSENAKVIIIPDKTPILINQ